MIILITVLCAANQSQAAAYQPENISVQSQTAAFDLEPGIALFAAVGSRPENRPDQAAGNSHTQGASPAQYTGPVSSIPANSLTGNTEVLISAAGSSVTVSKTLSADELKPNELLVMTLSVDDPVDLYYYGLIIEFDPDLLDFESVQNIGLTEKGSYIGGMINENQAAVAVSRTDTTESIQSGSFMELTFRVASTPETGQTLLEFKDPQMNDSHGDPIVHDSPGPAQVEVVEGIGQAEITTPEFSEVTEGEPFEVTAAVFASGISDDAGNTDRVKAWIGVNAVDSDPETWDESVWQPFGSAGYTESALEYSGEVALYRDVGDWSMAIRTRLDEGEFFYGGLNGFWNGADSRSASLTIRQQDAYGYALASWDFDEGSLFPGFSIPANDLSEIQIAGANTGSGAPLDTQTSDGVTYLNTRGWHDEGEGEGGDGENGQDGEKYIHVVISTSQFEKLRLNSSHTGSPTGPGELVVQLSQDGSDWEDLQEGEIDLTAESTVHLQNLPIPEEYNDRDRVYVRWLKAGDERMDEEGGGISSAGIHRIGDIRITGNNMAPQRVDVMPGDINRDGIVNAQDVLYLGHYWMSRGPAPVYDFIEFKPREVEEWIPGEATYADANGDGVVNHRDLMPIGLNFGKTVQPGKQTGDTEPLAQTGLMKLESGEEVVVEFQGEGTEILKGLAYRLTLEGIPEEAWEVDTARLPGWAEKWDGEERLLEFRKKKGHAFEEAFIVQGRHEQTDANQLAKVRILAKETWPASALLNLEWAVASRPGGRLAELEEVEITVNSSGQGEAPDDEDPDATALHQNYPNPFRPQTLIRYQISNETQVRLEVYNTAGRRVATLIDDQQSPGYYAVDFDAGHLASGVYLYRLQAGESYHTRSMVLVK